MNSLIFTATYNEAGNIERLVKEIFQIEPSVDIFIIDDNSPDGTGKLLDAMSLKFKKLKVRHRTGKLGLGSAHIEAMKYAVENNYDILITMDADFSHDPKYLPEMLKLIETNDFVIGSRYVKGGGLGYGFIRTAISKTANFLARLLLSIKLKECTTSFRAFRKDLLIKILDQKISSTGYSFFFEMVFIVTRLTSKVSEFPIYFADRIDGESKISKNEIYRGVVTLFKLFLNRFNFKKK
ncbi:MAG: polyprenol monophosphomannose synthase [Leptospira sp.]|nr:polyprenol monophosphomannose synthase [Leptospira sp.]NCS94812.1 polyprenol monophosphomannose synthase [Leptospira sp.]